MLQANESVRAISGAGPELAFRLRRRIRFVLAIFMAGLIISGVTAFPLHWELGLLARLVAPQGGATATGLQAWVLAVNAGKAATDSRYPFLAYGTDWLAFGHLVIAAFFLGVWIDPVRNKFIISAGLAACVGVVLVALIAGPIRGIPFGWRLIDCSFGVVGAPPLLLIRAWTRRLEQYSVGQRDSVSAGGTG